MQYKTLSRAQYPACQWRPAYISLAYLIYFRMITFYLFPMLAECGRGSTYLQSPVTYQVEMDQCNRSFESVMPDYYLYSFKHPPDSDITPRILSLFCKILLVVWSANSGSALYLTLPRLSSNSLNNGGTLFQVNLLNDNTYRWNCATSSYKYGNP